MLREGSSLAGLRLPLDANTGSGGGYFFANLDRAIGLFVAAGDSQGLAVARATALSGRRVGAR